MSSKEEGIIDQGVGEYGGEQVQIKEGLEHVRARPGMYIGDTGERGLHHLVYEVMDNSVDESLAGYCGNIGVEILEGNVVSVADDGRGIPVDMHPEAKVSTLEVVMTRLGAGGKFDSEAYKVSGGLHGVGVSVVNGLSEWCEAYVYRGGYEYFQRYERGKPCGEVEKRGESDLRGTKIIFKADVDIFEVLEYNFEGLSRRFRELAFLNKGLRIEIWDRRGGVGEGVGEVFMYEGGIVSYVEYLNRGKKELHEKKIYLSGEKNEVYVELALGYNEGYKELIYSYANNINTLGGGTHLSGFKSALTRVMNDSVKKFGYEKKLGGNLEGEDVREGLVAIVSIKHKDPQFEGQTKGKLGNSEVKGIVESVMSEGLKIFFEENPKVCRLILEKSISACMTRRAIQSKREALRKGFLDRDTLPGKLSDCSERDPKVCELYIVEGDSAGGSAKQGRSREFQAVLPLKGKMLNVEKSKLEKILQNDKLQPVIATLGTGFGKDFNIEKLRYHKIIIMADADVDGSHIRTLLLTFFYRYLLEVVVGGYVYIAMPPLYKIQNGKSEKYAFNDEERNKILSGLTEKEKEKVYIQRYKGLGEMNPDQLWNTTMDPEVRSMYRVRLEDAESADQIFSILMGDKVEPRRNFIESYGDLVLETLDV